MRSTIPFVFKGRTREYFRLWITGLLLSGLTLGLYMPWWRVRLRQYLYSRTSLHGDSFSFDGNPRALVLDQLLLSAGLIGFYWFDWNFIVLALTFALAPWWLRRHFAFTVNHTSYAGQHLEWQAPSLREFYTQFFKYALFVVVSLGLASVRCPIWIWRCKFGHVRYGVHRFQLSDDESGFYAIFLRALLIYILSLLGLGMALAGFEWWLSLDPSEATIMGQALVLAYLPLAVSGLYVQARFMEYFWPRTKLGENIDFVADYSSLALIRLQMVNLVAVVVTFGLAYPWARLRLARFRAAGLSVIFKSSEASTLASLLNRR